MNKEFAVNFLKKYQPMPSDNILSEELINQYDLVRKYFLNNPDEECIPLLLNSFGEYDGMGVYQLLEDVLLKFKHDKVVVHLKQSLKNKYNGVRYWSAQIASSFPDEVLINPLEELLYSPQQDIRLAAISALSSIDDGKVIKIIVNHLNNEKDSDAVEFINMVLEDLSNK
ncbi:HEAT repeat domain-containing protein [Clostridium saccharobutylicum]|uniref:HEAT repeat protein n=1 Tax=Clostridium saccharobutylicum TaxID=169679 RepID=A0A1S8MQ60_CLOSA|nr:HEAT repeat domain-containing protein [Clostridium saccharobutylicum]OOM06329.1 hypothetical protein CLOSAC_42480 [Clostridium saccharobutylicum]